MPAAGRGTGGTARDPAAGRAPGAGTARTAAADHRPGTGRSRLQAAADALLAITAKLGQFRGESRFTTWAYKFVIFEVSTKVGRHFWRNPSRSLDAEDWTLLPDRLGLDPAQESESRDLLAAVRRAVDTELTPRQREVFVAIALNQVPLDTLVIKLGTNRNAVYKMMFDARRKLHTALVANGYLTDEESRRS